MSYIFKIVKKNRKSRLLGHVNFDGQNHRFVRKGKKTDLFPDLDITFRILDMTTSRSDRSQRDNFGLIN